MELDEMIMKYPEPMKGPPDDYIFYDLTDEKTKNEHGSNLTELSAAGSYFERGYATHRDWVAHMARFFVVSRKTRLNKSTLLDVGCGKLGLPYTLNQARRQPAVYWGLDLRANEAWGNALQWRPATRLVKLDLIDHDPTVLPEWPAEGFDAVTCFEVLEHVPRKHARLLMLKLFHWTKPGGLCMVSTPNYGTSTSVAKNHIGPDGEIREWSYDKKLLLAKSVGFEIEDVFGTFIRLDQLPAGTLDNPVIQAAKDFLHGDWFSAFVASAFPRESNNAMMMLRRPK
jgi:2-polyprenyl-3-methyl-5-hydroxy-6-metoxy-1,4-benzoquinol methylase